MAIHSFEGVGCGRQTLVRVSHRRLSAVRSAVVPERRSVAHVVPRELHSEGRRVEEPSRGGVQTSNGTVFGEELLLQKNTTRVSEVQVEHGESAHEWLVQLRWG